jgi:pimeloyl-ACP methyl ester carboxylesterase
MDIARAVVQDEAFNFLGKSYGTMLGATYAELFPERVGRMVLDGALPPSLDMVAISKGQAEAFEVALKDFVENCLTHDDCPLTGTADDGVQQVRDWLAGLDSDPITSGDRDLSEPLAAYAILSYLYFPAYDYDDLRPALASAMNDRDATPLLSLLDQRISRAPDGTYLDNSTDAFYSVTCLDRPFTGTVDDVRRYAAEWAVTAPTFGAALAWGMLPCKDWPASGDVVTDTKAAGSNPILVVSTKNDPATPYQWGVQLADELENATLLSWNGFGHTAYFEQSSCIDDTVNAYLLQGTVPASGFLCE